MSLIPAPVGPSKPPIPPNGGGAGPPGGRGLYYFIAGVFMGYGLYKWEKMNRTHENEMLKLNLEHQVRMLKIELDHHIRRRKIDEKYEKKMQTDLNNRITDLERRQFQQSLEIIRKCRKT